MPGYLADDHPSHSISFDPKTDFHYIHDKTNGLTAQPSQQSTSTANDSFDEESSTHSTQISEVSDAHPGLNGIMDGLPNGTHDGKANGTAVREKEVARKQLPNGVSGPTVLPDRSIHQRPPSTNGNDTPVTSLHDGYYPRTSLSTAREGSIQQSPVEMYLQSVGKVDVRSGDATTPPATTATNAQTPSPSQSSAPGGPSNHPFMSNPEVNVRNTNPPHRFSSPPLYQPGGHTSAPASSSSAALQPPPPGTGLKHRHTLEVPKVTSARGSRDGSIDAAFSSGRFSPTSLGPGARRPSLSLARRNTRSLPPDEVVPDEDALRWAEAYRQKRASKRKKMEREDDDRVLVGTKVDESHANWVTAYNMLTGIRVSVSRTNAKLDRPLTDADFQAKQKSTFDIAGNELVPSAKYDFKFKDYAPWVFRHLRALFRLDPADYLMSLTGKYILSELGSPGKSGSFFYFSRDYKYIIKTIHHAEHKFLRKILKDYYDHVTENPNTLLSQFYGLHRVKMPYGKKIHFVVMNNLFPPHRDIHETFDLKGSTIGRDYTEENLVNNPRATLKDLNWLRRHRHLELGLQKKRLFLDQLHRDVRLLQRLKIMDYSLLVGIHDVRRGNEENLRDKTLQVFSPGGHAVHDESDPTHSVLMRTPSKLESQRKARELRQMIKNEKPVPMGQTATRMPDELEDGLHRPGFVFNQDDGGFGATHEDNSAGEEIYYLGVIDCLTHYGIIKKLENFWKGLSSDRTQISPVPPHEYGERFMNFISGVTMSAEEATREAQEKDAARIAAAAAERGDRERVGSWGSSTRRRQMTNNIPPIPDYNPPPVPPNRSGALSPEQELTLQRAQHQADKTERHGAREDDVPNRTLKAASVPGAIGSVTLPVAERREAGATGSATALPVVEEAAEGGSSPAGSQSRNSHTSSTAIENDERPLTPAKDGPRRSPDFGNYSLGGAQSAPPHPTGPPPPPPHPTGPPPPTPPKAGYGTTLKPESADSGYGVATTGDLKSVGGSLKSLNRRGSISRESLDKALPPLPRPGMAYEVN